MSADQNPMTHPDENLLAAFAEQALTGAERASVLMHLSGCARCREIVFLAQESFSEPEAAPQPALRPARSRWLRWQTATAAAWVLALAVAMALLWHSHRNSSALNEQAILHPARPPAPAPAENALLAKTAPAPPPPSPAIQVPAKQETAEKKSAAAPKSLGWGANVEARRGAPQSGMFGQSYIAPPAGAPQQQNAIATGELRSMPSQGKPVEPQESESVTVQAAPVPLETAPTPTMFPTTEALDAAKSKESAPREQAALPGSTTLQLNAPLSSPQFSVVKGKLQRFGPGGYTTVALPAGTRAHAVAAQSNIVVLLTSRKALYRSTDYGEHWIPIPVQWSGKPSALRLKFEAGVSSQQIVARDRKNGLANYNAQETDSRSIGTLQSSGGNDSLSSQTPAAKAAAPKTAPVMFELINGTGKCWLSRDGGQTWQPE
ncbi:MAG TPA: zf-HC2 domain-containing protein [Terracidiphilus sp.]